MTGLSGYAFLSSAALLDLNVASQSPDLHHFDAASYVYFAAGKKGAAGSNPGRFTSRSGPVARPMLR